MPLLLKRLAPWSAFLALIVALHSPRLLALETGLAAAAMLAYAAARQTKLRLRDQHVAVALLVFAIYALASTIWSLNPVATLGKAAFTILMTIAVVAGLEASQATPPEALRGHLRWVLAAAFAGLALAAFEVWTDEYLQRRLFTAFPRLYAGFKSHIKLDDDGSVASLQGTNIKRRIGMVTLWIWPMALAIRATLAGRRRMLAWGLLAAGVIATIVLGPHLSSRVAIAAGLLMLLAMLANEKLSLRALAVGWLCLILLALPMAWKLHSAKLYEAPWMPASARARIVIWNATATEAMKRPLLGIGADATITAKPSYEQAQQGRREGSFLVTIERHAHNSYLQVWMELGAIGAMLAAGVVLVLVTSLRGLPGAARPFAAAYLATVAGILFSSYGLWQMWLQASIAVSAFGLLLSARALRLNASG